MIGTLTQVVHRDGYHIHLDAALVVVQGRDHAGPVLGLTDGTVLLLKDDTQAPIAATTAILFTQPSTTPFL